MQKIVFRTVRSYNNDVSLFCYSYGVCLCTHVAMMTTLHNEPQRSFSLFGCLYQYIVQITR